MIILDSFHKQKYLNLETFRKNGHPVRTPVWFVLEDDVFFVITVANSGKVKRIRNNNRVNIAPCKVNGIPINNWFSAKAREISDSGTKQRVNRLMNRKYGFMKKFFEMQRTRKGAVDTILEIVCEQENMS